MLKDTGERVIPEKMDVTDYMLIEHLARYHFANLYVRGRVLDLACGSGYGTHIIAKRCRNQLNEVIGIDNSREALDYARYSYYHPKSTFIEEDVVSAKLPQQLGQFDSIVSFETLEHIKEEEQFLNNIYDMLKPGGSLILSTPFGQGRDKPCGNPFHIHQLTVKEFKELFTRYESATFYYQAGALIVPEEFANDTKFPIGIVVCQK